MSEIDKTQENESQPAQSPQKEEEEEEKDIPGSEHPEADKQDQSVTN